MIKQDLDLLQLAMNRKRNLFFFLTFFLITHCSFDNKTGIWQGDKREKTRIVELEKEQKKQIIEVVDIHSSDSIYSKESIGNRISISTFDRDCTLI